MVSNDYSAQKNIEEIFNILKGLISSQMISVMQENLSLKKE